MTRISETFARLKTEKKAAFVPFIMAGDPSYEVSFSLLKALPDIGADIIELGIAFTDPMADGPSIQSAGLRALDAGATLTRTLEMVTLFRQQNTTTPIVLMGYYNPIFSYGVEQFLTDASAAGVDGLIIVDLPPEEDDELCLPAMAAGIDFIRLATPTTDAGRLPVVVNNTSGFVYYVSVAGVTGRSAGGSGDVAAAVSRLKAASGLPVAVGFGVKTGEKAAQFAKIADAVVVGSALVDELARALEANANQADNAVNAVLTLAGEFADAVHNTPSDAKMPSGKEK